MPKLRAPLFSLKATGRLGKFLTLAKRQGRHIIERRPIPTDAKSPSQLFSRLMFTKCIDLWHLLSDAERQEWESLARSRHMTGYAWYISQCLRPNPGIYLPLIGGTMTGDIDMATNRILNLPDPTTPQEPDTRFARSTALLAAIAAHAGIPAAHHARYTDAEVDAILAVHAALVTGVHGAGDSILATTLNIATHAAIAAAHHARYADAEAVTAMGVKGDANPLHHDKYTLEAHADTHENGGGDEIDVGALSGLLADDQHIINAEAVAAAKTVKLDDFATPDDNTNLNASAARHGLLKKLNNVATDYLNGQGNWAAVIAGKSIATGSYTGDNTNNRQIATGFKCSLVLLGEPVSPARHRICYPNITYEPSGGTTKTDCLLHATDGFVVDLVSSNHLGVYYSYWAIEE